MSHAEPERKNTIRPAQVVAAGLAALTAAFLGSTLGVYGTVIGAGVVSVLTTVGSEFYLRSLERTAQAARRSREAAVVRNPRSPLAGPTDEPTPDQPEHASRPRWPLIAGASVAAFALGMAVITGIEGLTGNTISGGEGSTLSKVASGGGAPVEPAEQAPVTGETDPMQETTTPAPTATTTTTEPAGSVAPSSVPEDATTSQSPPAEPSVTGPSTTLVPPVSP